MAAKNLWNDEKEALLLREVTVVEPFKYREKTKERGDCWNVIANNLNAMPDFKVTQRAVREKTINLLERFKTKQRLEAAATGVSPETSETDVLLEEILVRIEDYQKQYDDANKKQKEDKELGENIRKDALETFKRKKNEDDECGSSKRQRRSSTDTIRFLREKMEAEHKIREQELELRRKQLELDEQKANQEQENSNNMMQILVQQMVMSQQMNNSLIEHLKK